MLERGGKYLVLLIASFSLILICFVIVTDVSGGSSDAYKSGEYSGYNLHNESTYNASVLYINTHFDDSLGFGWKSDLYYQAYGYAKGYKRWVDENKRSEMRRLLESE